MNPPFEPAGGAQRARDWLSHGLSHLFDEHDRDGQPASPPHFDVVIVGSGYGGAVAAAMLAGCQVKLEDGEQRRARIAVLERGDEYLPGDFPSSLSELPGHVRCSLPGQTEPWGRRWGLFDVRVSADVVTVLANGLGGGSLINAGVMLAPHDDVLAESVWPKDIRNDGTRLARFFECAGQWVGAGAAGGKNTLDRAGIAVPKLDLMKKLGGASVPITVALGQDATSSAGVPMQACIKCGDCATGCNHGAKESLDVNLLVHARRHDVDLYTGATVLRLEPRQEPRQTGWWVVVNHTDPALRRRQEEPLRIAADHVILAAGTFGSTEILKRSRARDVPVSDQLGRRFSCSDQLGSRFSSNGDLFAAAYDTKHKVNAVAKEADVPDKRNVGPTITAAIDWRRGDPSTDVSVQELAIPGPLRRLFEETFTTARVLHSLSERDKDPHAPGDVDRNAVDHEAFDRTVPFALISRDGADGRLELVDKGTDAEGDGALHVHWPRVAHDPRFDDHHERVQRHLKTRAVGGRLLPNPVWKLQPDDAAQVLGIDRGPLLTVHPLGGCPMGDNVHSGVVNQWGQVFKGAAFDRDAVHKDLAVLDGSIVPTSLGINPALTIAALAIRAVEQLRLEWNFTGGLAVGAALGPRPEDEWRQRPVFRTVAQEPDPDQPRPPRRATMVQLMERMGGTATLADGKSHYVQLTLNSEPVALTDLMSRRPERRIPYDGQRSVLRVFNGKPSPLAEDPVGPPKRRDALTGHAGELEACAQVSGSLDLFRLVASKWGGRTFRGLRAWASHRGVRDTVQRLAARRIGLEPPADPLKGESSGFEEFMDLVRGTLGLASRAGAVRTIEYGLWLTNLRVGENESPARLFGNGAAGPDPVLEIRGQKRLTYDGRHSPWLQLMEMTLDRFPGLSGRSAKLELDLTYLARQGVPLLRVVDQEDHVHALVDLAAFHLYALRTVLDAHMWSFRRPDVPPPRPINRLPGATRTLPTFEPVELQVAHVGKEPVRLRLTRYRPAGGAVAQNLPPVVLIHGYSASGTTFVHPTLHPGLGGRLVLEGRDVWVLDLRSSAGMPRAQSRHPWSFEEIGREDIPLAIDHVVRVCNTEKVDVVAHCMGAAMLCMGLLGDLRQEPVDGDWYPALRAAMRKQIRRIVLSQVGPVLVMSPANQARAFIMRYVKEIVPMGNYDFRPEGDGTLADLLLDRLLATLPYPDEEFRVENPLWPLGAATPWVRTRRRMDALYGQVFKLDNMPRRTLDHLDDFFGPMNVDTVSQVIHFTRGRAITDKRSRHVFATPERLQILEQYPILSIHGAENGLVDVSTADLLEKALRAGNHRAERIPDYGHQDCLIGRDPREVFKLIVDFLGERP